MSAFNPKLIAHNIANGLMFLNPVTMKKYLTDDLRVLLNQLTITLREIRAGHIDQENTGEVNNKNRQLQRLNQAIAMMAGYAKKLRLRL